MSWCPDDVATIFVRNILNNSALCHSAEHTNRYCQIAVCECEVWLFLFVILRASKTSQLTLGCAFMKRYWLQTFYSSVVVNTSRLEYNVLSCSQVSIPRLLALMEMEAMRSFETSGKFISWFVRNWWMCECKWMCLDTLFGCWKLLSKSEFVCACWIPCFVERRFVH